MKILTVIGARPQFVKSAVVSRALTEAGGFRETVVHTGQHFDTNMSDVFFRDFDTVLFAKLHHDVEEVHGIEIHLVA